MAAPQIFDGSKPTCLNPFIHVLTQLALVASRWGIHDMQQTTLLYHGWNGLETDTGQMELVQIHFISET